jgi:hypothetical protein
MVNLLKKHDILSPLERLYTRENSDAFALIHFREPAGESELECPENWSFEASGLMAQQSACPSIPSRTKSIEENTVPSWLWQRMATTRDRTRETRVQQIFHRLIGSATYAGWKKGVFTHEHEARIFYDELCYLFAQRFVALEPRLLAATGLGWAYGIEKKPSKPTAPASSLPFESSDITGETGALDIRNASIDSILGGETEPQKKWRRFLAKGMKSGALALHFKDIVADWNATPPAAPLAALDLLAFRREDGAIDSDRLRHAVRLLAMLLDLQGERRGGAIAIGFNNLAPLLMSLALPYDSDAGRATTAALAAIVTAESIAASARLAARLGPSLDFAANRETILRTLRNRRRAAWGDRNDYEKISVLPTPLSLDPGTDLGLIAAARRSWDEALELARQHGLRRADTDLSPVPALAFFMESTAFGIAPMPALIVARTEDGEVFRHDIHSSVLEGLVKLNYDAQERALIIAHIAGAGTLAHAPGIDHAALRRHGFTDETLATIENYLPYVNDIRLVFTPWILGEDFCRDVLKIPAAKRRDPRFDLLHHLGFSAAVIEAANKFCYGHGTARGAKALQPQHATIFAPAHEIQADARIRMAASVQSFVTGDVGMCLQLAEANAEEAERLLLDAWRQGIKSLTIEFVTEEKPQARATAKTSSVRAAKKAPTAPPLSSYATSLRSTLRGKPKAQGKLVSLKKPVAGKSTRPGKA